MGKRSLWHSFNDAIEGIIYAVKSQFNMKVHIAVAVLVLVASILLSVSRMEFLLVLIAVCIVLVTEMFNSALELTLDFIVDRYHPLARLIKDMAAGAVFIASACAVFIGYVVFFPRLKSPMLTILVRVHQSPGHVAVVALLLTFIFVVIAKAAYGRGTPLRGGMPSGHAALAFAVWTFLSILFMNPLITALVFILAILIAQSRIVSGEHNLLEVFSGAMLGVGVALLCFWIF
jgi:diacylglycerol kinase (ATP)